MSIQPVEQPAPPQDPSSRSTVTVKARSEENVPRQKVTSDSPVHTESPGISTKDLQDEMTETTREAVQEAAERVNEVVQNLKREIQFAVDEETGRFVITVINSSTKEVVRQIPSEEFLAISQNLDKAIGLILKTEA